jgi:hypothetical protein
LLWLNSPHKIQYPVSRALIALRFQTIKVNIHEGGRNLGMQGLLNFSVPPSFPSIVRGWNQPLIVCFGWLGWVGRRSLGVSLHNSAKHPLWLFFSPSVQNLFFCFSKRWFLYASESDEGKRVIHTFCLFTCNGIIQIADGLYF